MPTVEHRALIGVETDPIIVQEATDGANKTMIRFGRLVELIVGLYREERFEYVDAKPHYVLTSQGDRLLRGDLVDVYGPNTVEFMHILARKQLIKEGKLRGQIGYEGVHLPPKFSKLTYDEIVETLLWYAEYSSDEEREVIMEFLLTDGRCGGSYREFNEKNRRVQTILTQVSNSQVGQKFPKDDSL